MSAVYIYCVMRSARRPPMARVPAGMPGGSRPEAHAVAPALWIVSALVPLDVYGPSHLEPRLRDLEWVSQAAVAHEAVVEHCWRAKGATVVPMKLFTMFSTLDRAIHDVRSRRSDVTRAIRRIAGAEEWGIRVVRVPDATAGPRLVKPASGADFLRARSQAREAAASARATAAAAARRAFDRLRRLSRDARVRDGRTPQGTNPPLLDAAFLVASPSRARFKAEVRRQARVLSDAGADVALTGPWPAYTFVSPGEPT